MPSFLFFGILESWMLARTVRMTVALCLCPYLEITCIALKGVTPFQKTLEDIPANIAALTHRLLRRNKIPIY